MSRKTLHSLIPEGFRQRVEAAIQSRVQNEAALRRMAEIQDIVKRIDFSWEQGFLSPQEYVEKRGQLQKETEALRPIDYDSLMEAADLITNFKAYWTACEDVDNPEAARQQLVAKIVDRVFVYDRAVVAVALHGDFGVVLNAMGEAPPQISNAIGVVIEKKTGATRTATGCAQDGADGLGNHTNYWLLVPRNDYRSHVRWLLDAVPLARPFVQGPSLPTAAKMVLA